LAKGGALFEAVVLGAGAGSRFGGGKLTAPWRGGVLIDGALAAAFAAPARAVTVVWGADAAVPKAATAFAARIGEGVRLKLVHAERHAMGLSESLKAGITSLPPDCDGAFIFLGDMPRIPTSVLNPLAEAIAGGVEAAAPHFEGARGHPVLFGSALFPRLLELDGDRGAGGLLARLGDALALIPAPDDGVLYDVDQPVDMDDSLGR
jgi:molybdenum cofactor cytidylyltransferase